MGFSGWRGGLVARVWVSLSWNRFGFLLDWVSLGLDKVGISGQRWDKVGIGGRGGVEVVGYGLWVLGFGGSCNGGFWSMCGVVDCVDTIFHLALIHA